MGGIVLALLAGVSTVEESIGFLLFMEQEAVQVIQMAIYQAVRLENKAVARRLLNELEQHYLPMIYADLDNVWMLGVGFDIGGNHYPAFYGHSTFLMYADSVFELIQAYKLDLG